MPKVSVSSLPLSDQILIQKSRLFVEASQLESQAQNKGKGKKRGKGRRGRDNVKTGQGGTLDPLADGVLVVGVGKGTKRLNEFLDCSKEYQTTCLLGCETDSYDSEGARVRTAPWHHVTRASVESALEKFRGEIMQTPPIFSALKMDGMALYDYARKGIPLPRPIEQRKVTIHSLELIDWKGSDHPYRWPEKQFTQEEKAALEKSLSSVDDQATVHVEDESDPEPAEGEVPMAFVLKMRVSGGTYVRSIVHDLAHSLGSAGHVVTLTRTRQKNWVLGEPTEDGDRRCIPWEVIEKSLKDEGERDEEGWAEWERKVIDIIDVVEGTNDNP
ncbi:hypothetical protein EWM64_g1798 [Hericium alpestre]|uniref:tRNA pseudouridine(55) synthase n=1 Tax=Hericium alpestre TaxID=135208 RepID=A0A4Z0A7G5_9AGAM|nr:hypothetical protein EWM64_g1798 [Hericium alpestre]